MKSVPAVFEVLDVFEGFASLEKRSPTLDGSVPVRVAQACVPLLEGNAFGFQVVLHRALTLKRAIGGPRVAAAPADEAALRRLHAAALPRLAAHGLVPKGGAWHRALAKGFTLLEGPLAERRLRLFTGLLVRPFAGIWLRLSRTANRRSALYDVEERFVPDDGGFVPLVLTIRLEAKEALVSGEVATLAPVAPDVRVTEMDLADAPEVGRAHAAFYDAAYFETKRGESTGKYRKLVARERVGEKETRAEAEARVVAAGPRNHEVRFDARFLTAKGPEPERRPDEARRLPSVVFRNAIAFTALFDGHALKVDTDRPALSRAARRVEQSFRDVYGEGFLREHEGALWYLTKYVTPHPPGEPHFFVKPFAFVTTPPGWSCLLEGVPGEGYDVLRGVVSSDVFHATPAVFLVRRVGVAIRVPAGTPLLEVLPVPRRLLDAGFRVFRLPDEP